MSGCSGGSCTTCSGGSCSTCGGAEPDPNRLPPGMLRQYDVNQSTADGVMVWVETEGTGEDVRLAEVSAEILAAAKSMNDGRLFAVVFGGLEVKPLYPEIFGYGVDTLYHVRDRKLETYSPEAYTDCLAEIADRIVPAVILMGATPRGREVAPRLASLMKTGLTADCTALSMDGRKLTMTRPAFGGSLEATIECSQFPQMATVRRGTFPRPERREGTGTAIYWQYTGDVAKEILSDVSADGSSTDIRDARILISLGNGVTREAVDSAMSVAKKLGAEVSCSRPLVDKGWLPHCRQVGMSGTNVSPDIYMAFGISGSIQHRSGMMNAKKVIAVNTDPHAPIHGFADLSILSDASQVLAEMDKSL